MPQLSYDAHSGLGPYIHTTRTFGRHFLKVSLVLVGEGGGSLVVAGLDSFRLQGTYGGVNTPTHWSIMSGLVGIASCHY